MKRRRRGTDNSRVRLERARAGGIAATMSIVAALVVLVLAGPWAGGVLAYQDASFPARTDSAGNAVATRERAFDRERDRTGRFLLVEVERDLSISARPGRGRIVGTMPAGSRYYDAPTVAWVREVSRDGLFGLVDVPYADSRASGWIPLRGLSGSWTRTRVVADLSNHRITVRRGDDVVLSAPAATGAQESPTPVGHYFVSDRVPFPGGGLGSYAFGISGVQPNLPAGWTSGNQLAIHGTGAPSTIGRSASAGCLRVSEEVLDLLKPLLRLGTPVVVRP